MSGAGVALRQQVGHIEGLGVEGAPGAAEVIADVFAEVDGGGAFLAEELGLHEAFADGDDGGAGPGFLDFARGPEGGEEGLWE